jgi:hypothetical protein
LDNCYTYKRMVYPVFLFFFSAGVFLFTLFDISYNSTILLVAVYGNPLIKYASYRLREINDFDLIEFD